MKQAASLPRPPLPEARLRLLREQRVEVETELVHGAAHVVVDAEIDQVVAEMRTEQVLGREIADRASALLSCRRQPC